MSHRIYRCKERLEILKVNCDFIENDEMAWDELRFKDEKLPTCPIKPDDLCSLDEDILTSDLKEDKKKVKEYKKACKVRDKDNEEHLIKMKKYDKECLRISKLSDRPKLEDVLAIREEIGIINKLWDKLNILRPNLKCDIAEDDYHSVVLHNDETQTLPTLKEIMSDKTNFLYLTKIKKESITLDFNTSKSKVLTYIVRENLMLGRLTQEEVEGINRSINKLETKRDTRISNLDKAKTLTELNKA